MGYSRVVEDADQVALGHFADVSACGERLAAAGEHHSAYLVIPGGCVQRSGQLCQ
ncbi:hypothetical protein D3C87_2202260 [compost metagenome]